MRLGAAKAMVLVGTVATCPGTASWPLPLKDPSALFAAATVGQSPSVLRRELERGSEALKQHSLEH
jgi:hypothetical protein